MLARVDVVLEEMNKHNIRAVIMSVFRVHVCVCMCVCGWCVMSLLVVFMRVICKTFIRYKNNKKKKH